MKRQTMTMLAVFLVIVAISTQLLIWASSTSHFIFTQYLNLQNSLLIGPEYFQTGPAYQTVMDITYLGKTIAQLEITVGPPYVNSSEIPLMLQVTQQLNFELDSVEVTFSSSIHNKLTYQPDFYLKPNAESDTQPIEVYTSTDPYGSEVTLKAKNLNGANQGKFYQELIFSPTNPDTSKSLEFKFKLLITMHEKSLIQLTSLRLDSNLNLAADALYP
jgi:hypothetical protein